METTMEMETRVAAIHTWIMAEYLAMEYPACWTVHHQGIIRMAGLVLEGSPACSVEHRPDTMSQNLSPRSPKEW